MKKIITKNIVLLAYFIHFNPAMAQTSASVENTSYNIQMLFPEGKSKALILSFDDGTISDRTLVKLMNDCGLIGTFNLNSNKLGSKIYFNHLTKEEVKLLYKGHEVSVHTADHPPLTTLSKIDIIYQVVEDRKELEIVSLT